MSYLTNPAECASIYGMSYTETVQGLEPIGPTVGKHKGRSRAIRSAATNGTRAYVCGNGNSPWARRQRDFLDQYISDQGGIDHVTAVVYAKCRMAASLGVERELMEGKRSLGQEIDLDQFGRLIGQERRVLESLGADRIAKPAANSVLDHFERRP